MVKLNHNEVDDLFLAIIHASGQDPYNAWVRADNWSPALVVDGKVIDGISSNDGESVNLVWYDAYEDPNPISYYNKMTEIEENPNLFIALFGGKI